MPDFAQKQDLLQLQTSLHVGEAGGKAQAASHQPHLMHLQHTIGNQAVLRLMRASAIGPHAHAGAATSFRPNLGHDFGRAPAHPRSPAVVQTKLTVNSPGDVYEQEADHVSEQVMRAPEPQLQRSCACGGTCDDCQKKQSGEQPAPLQMKRTDAGGPGETEAPPSVHEALQSPGQPLDSATRAFMEPRFGQDFSHVRVHTDQQAAASARAVSAQAYTVGPHVVFGAGAYETNTDNGRKLLAHELTHVAQQDGQQGQGRAPSLQRQVSQLSECKTCHDRDPHPMPGSAQYPMTGSTRYPMTGSSDPFFHVSESGMFDWVKQEAWEAAVGHGRPTVIFSLLQRHDDDVLNAFWRFYIATSQWAGSPGPEWTKMVEDLNERAVKLLVQEIKDTLLSHVILRGSALQTDPKRIKQIEDTPDEQGLSLSVGMGARDIIKPKRELAGLRVRSASPSVLYYEVIGHEHIYFEISEEDLRVNGGTAALIAKESTIGPAKIFSDFWEAVGKFSKGLLSAFASPMEMIVDTAAKIIDLLTQGISKRTNSRGWFDTPFTCLSSTCREAKACLDRGEDLHDCQTEALKQAAESASIVIPLYRQGQECLNKDYEACGALAPLILGLIPTGGGSLAMGELEEASAATRVEEAPSSAAKAREATADAANGARPRTQAELEDEVIREAIGRPEADAPSLEKAMERPKAEEKPSPAAKSKAPESEQLAKIHKKQVGEFADRYHLNPKQLEAELAQLSEDATNPSKVEVPVDNDYDAEITTSANGEIHEFERERYGTKRWCRFSSSPGKCGAPVSSDVDAKVDETLGKNIGKAAKPVQDEVAADPNAKADQPSTTDSAQSKHDRRAAIAEQVEGARRAEIEAKRRAESRPDAVPERHPNLRGSVSNRRMANADILDFYRRNREHYPGEIQKMIDNIPLRNPPLTALERVDKAIRDLHTEEANRLAGYAKATEKPFVNSVKGASNEGGRFSSLVTDQKGLTLIGQKKSGGIVEFDSVQFNQNRLLETKMNLKGVPLEHVRDQMMRQAEFARDWGFSEVKWEVWEEESLQKARAALAELRKSGIDPRVLSVIADPVNPEAAF